MTLLGRLLLLSWTLVGLSYCFAEDHYQIECQIFDSQRKLIKDFGGPLCVFLNDGSWIKGFYGGIQRYSATGDLLWQVNNLSVDHDISITKNGRHLVGFFYRIEMKSGQQRHFDVLFKLDVKTGKLISTYDVGKNIGKFALDFPGVMIMRVSPEMDFGDGKKQASFEYTHFNTIYEIPETPLAHWNPAFKKGNFIASAYGRNSLFIFDKNLKQVLWYHEIPGMKPGIIFSNLHDAQVLPSGKILIYSNTGLCEPKDGKEPEKDQCGKGKRQTSLNLYNPVDGKVECLYPRPEVTYEALKDSGIAVPGAFSSTIGGGVQLFENGSILFNVNWPEGGTSYLLNSKNQIEWSYAWPKNWYLKMKKVDLTEFLKKNKI